MGNTGLVASR